MLILVSATLSFSMVSLLTLRKVALVHGFVDRPTRRKAHQGDVPFIGGISLFITIVGVSLIDPKIIPFQQEYFYCSFFLVLVGSIDDKFDISARFRFVFLVGLSLWLSLYQGVEVERLGNILGDGGFELGQGSVLFTSLAIVGCIIAFNMADGIDGLLGGLASITFLGLALLFYHSGQRPLVYFCLIFVLAMFPYILCNLELIPRKSFKVFMGDSGSFFIGFTIVWLLIESSQAMSSLRESAILRPVTALWLIAVPLMDMVMVMARRIRKRQSPFTPDRMHLHHICQRLGLSSRQTLSLIVLLASIHMIVGVYGQRFNVSESIMFTLFWASFFCYATVITYSWKITRFVRKHQSKRKNINEPP